MDPLVTSLWITLIGMGLVFIAILLLWGLMEALMRLTARFVVAEAQESSIDEAEPAPQNPPSRTDLKKRAAVAAVAVALHLHNPAARPPQQPLTGSTWQAVNRSSLLNTPTHVQRKNRGSDR